MSVPLTAPLLPALRVITVLGAVPTILGMAIIVAICFAYAKRTDALVVWLAALVGTGMTIGILKVLVHRARPAMAVPGLGDAVWSFPSGHAALATVTYGLLAYVAIRETRRRAVHLLLGVTCGVLILAIAGSRIVLGMHDLSDVVGGLVVGGCWATAGIAVLMRAASGRCSAASAMMSDLVARDTG
jgi:undecaprenyl-diphosphatase